MRGEPWLASFPASYQAIGPEVASHPRDLPGDLMLGVEASIAEYLDLDELFAYRTVGPQEA